MKVIMAMVISIDGKLTKGTDKDIYKWTSKEDQKFFFSLIQKNNLVVMGRKTYDAVKQNLKLEKDRLRIVLTRNPELYASERVADKIEFSNASPKKLIKMYGKRGYKQMLLISGSPINTLFFKSGCIDELYLTIEPHIFGKGNPLVTEEALDVSLKLMSMKKINPQGTVLLHYKVNK